MNIKTLFRWAIPGYVTGVTVAKTEEAARKQVLSYMEAYHGGYEFDGLEVWNIKADETYDNEFAVCECGY